MYKNKIKYWQKKRGGISNKHLAECCDVSEQTFSSWVNNHTQPDLIEGSIIAKELRTTLNELVEEIKPKLTKEEFFNQPIEYLNFEPRYFQLLKRNGIHTFEDLLNQDLTKLRGVGKKKLEILEPKISELKEMIKTEYGEVE